MARTPFLLAVMGPTASGKTPVAERLAEHYDAQLVNADAFQVYRGFDVGTAKPDHRERYRLIDICNPDEQFGVGQFVAIAQDILAELWQERRSAILVGGTGLYIRALMEEYEGIKAQPDPALRNRLEALELEAGLKGLIAELSRVDPRALATVDTANPLRVRRAVERALTPTPGMEIKLPPFIKVKIALDTAIEELTRRIEHRTEQMLYNGFVEEVTRLRNQGVSVDAPAMRGIGYGTIWRHLDGHLTLEEAKAEVVLETRKYAKRQRTWLRSEPKVVRLDTLEKEMPLVDQAICYIDSVLSGDIGEWARQ